MSYDKILLDCPTKALAESILGEEPAEIFVTVVHCHSKNGEPSYIYSDFDGHGKYKAYTTQALHDYLLGSKDDEETDEENEEPSIVMFEFNGKKYPIPENEIKENEDGSIDMSDKAFKSLPKKVQKELMDISKNEE